MGDPKIVAELRAAAEDALSRGFAVLTCEPRGKAPWARYSPHAVNSSNRKPEIALRAWDENEEANYGVGCGPSNLTVVDVDHGINNIEEFEQWRTIHNLPETFTVLSGRDGFGAHMYYSGAVNTTKFDIAGVTGELKGIGGYVVGPGSIHPSGKKYTIYRDVPVAPLPAGFVNMAKVAVKDTKLDLQKTKSEHNGLVPVSMRWEHIRSTAGKLRNAGFSDEEDMFAALVSWTEKNCEDGANYPQEKIREIAHAAVTKFDAAEPNPIVVMGDKNVQTSISEAPIFSLEGDWIGELAHLVSDGTFIPLAFARAQAKAVLATAVNGLVGFPKQPDIHLKQWNMLVSAQPESGKGESWKRVAEAALANFIKKASVGLPKAGYFSSGEHMIKYLADPDNGMPDNGYGGKNVLVYFDELKALFEKGTALNSTLFTKLIELYDREDSSAGSLSHQGGEFKNISLSLTGGFTGSSFDAAVSGKGAGGDGFLSRCVLSYTGDIKYKGDWADQDTAAINALAQKMFDRYQLLMQMYQDKKNADANTESPDPLKWRFVPVESDAAKLIRLQFQDWMFEKRQEHNEKHPGAGYMSRLESHFKRDLLMRCLFSGDTLGEITEEMTKRSFEWAKHELYLREELYPVDRGSVITRMEQTIIRALEKHHALTKTELQRYCNVKRAESGGVGTFVQAWKNLLQGDAVEVVGRTHKNTEKFALREGF